MSRFNKSINYQSFAAIVQKYRNLLEALADKHEELRNISNYESFLCDNDTSNKQLKETFKEFRNINITRLPGDFIDGDFKLYNEIIELSLNLLKGGVLKLDGETLSNNDLKNTLLSNYTNFLDGKYVMDSQGSISYPKVLGEINQRSFLLKLEEVVFPVIEKSYRNTIFQVHKYTEDFDYLAWLLNESNSNNFIQTLYDNQTLSTDLKGFRKDLVMSIQKTADTNELIHLYHSIKNHSPLESLRSSLARNFKGFKNKEERLSIFKSELELTIGTGTDYALVGIIENPRARKYRFKIVGAHNTNERCFITAEAEDMEEAAYVLVRISNEIQRQHKKVVRQILLTDEIESDED